MRAETLTLVEVVRRFRQQRVLVIGDAMLDSYLEGTAARLCSEGPVPVVRKTAERRTPGGAANTAANLRALGADVVFLGVVGRDLAGTLLRAVLREHDVDDRWLIEDEEAETLHKLRILADSQYVVRFDEGGRGHYAPSTQKRVLSTLDRAFSRCDLVVVSDYGYGVTSHDVIDRLRLLRRARPCVLLVDSKEPQRFRAAAATMITPNHLEARLAVGEPPTTLLPTTLSSTTLLPTALLPTARQSRPSAQAQGAHHAQAYAEIESVARALLDIVDAEHAAITMAGDGVMLMDRHGRAQHLPAHPVAYANDVGAGDTFAAATALALAAGARPPDAVRVGIDASGIAVTKRGTSTVHHQELLQRVSLRDYATHHPHLQPAGGADDAVPREEARHSHTQLAAHLESERRAGRTIVFTNGVFDILHAGHVQFLRQAKTLGDILVVGINSDRSAQRLKGHRRPVTGEQERMALVAALGPVDHVVLFDEETPAAAIRALRPHIHAKGGDYADEALPEADAVRDVGGCIAILPLVGSLSTSSVIDRILALAGEV